MTMAVVKQIEPGFLNDADRTAATEAGRALARFSGRGCVRVEAYADSDERQTFVLPAQAVTLLTDILAYLAEGRAVSVIPRGAALTTQQAADMLNVSRPYLVGLLEKQVLPFERVGTHRRVAFGDLMAYMHRRDAAADEVMNELAAEAQELAMDY
ncbi:excisionase family DNA-binding protein [Tanticharoenia sakaeratensis]|uniref:Excisionase domain-containing protein n=1 Tax=Tanticharoenia sakaeratensis NBRC 103193 TaxID=1231623 RepID=A0A0D6MHR4_9PROT|nr:excisionase family DNA-binding protein [Tanticharoenia sakaeratensis]GAN53172.1 excisionase domain-containing protein [Tanticharoenia sakaeratensis NBRC 103193]GBQ23927.1 DNA binding domain protein [Tanticharoenia sakaeratensis NBRC 103193]